MRKRGWTLSAVTGALGVAVVVGAVQYAATGSGAENNRAVASNPPTAVAEASSESAEPEGTKTGDDFTLRYVPDGFHASNAGTAKSPHAHGKSKSAKPQKKVHTVGNRADDPVERSVHYNNIPVDRPSSAASSRAVFEVATVTNASPDGLRKRKKHNPRAHWITIHGHKALVEPPEEKPGLQAVEWHVGSVEVSVVGRGMTMDQVLRIAKGVRLS